MIILSVALAVVLAILVMILCNWFDEPVAEVRRNMLILGISVGAINFLAPKVPAWVALLLLVIMLSLQAFLVFYWRINGSNAKEILVISLMDGLISLTATACAVRIWDLTNIKWLGTIIGSLPLMVAVISVGYFIADAIQFHQVLQNLEGGDRDEE